MASRKSSDMTGVSGKWPVSAIVAIGFAAVALLLVALILILRPVPEKPTQYSVRLVPFLTEAGLEVGFRPEEPVTEILLPLPAETHDALSIAMNAEIVSLEPRDNGIALVGSEPWELATLVIDRSLSAPDRAYPLVQYGTGAAVVNMGLLRPVAVDGNRVAAAGGAARFQWIGRPLVWEGEDIAMLYEEALPVPVQVAIGDSIAILNDYYKTALGGPLGQVPQLMLLYSAGEPGRIGIEGDTVPGQAVIRFSGGGFQAEGDEARRSALENIAHEMAHLWQLERGGVSQAPDWLHEGGAEAIGLESLYITEIYSEADYAAMLDRARTGCAQSLRGGPLEDAAARGDTGAAYACGTMLWAALASQRDGATVVSTWRAFAEFAEGRRGGQSANTFHAFAREWTGNDGFARSARRFVSADWSGGRGGLVIDGLFAGDL